MAEANYRNLLLRAARTQRCAGDSTLNRSNASHENGQKPRFFTLSPPFPSPAALAALARLLLTKGRALSSIGTAGSRFESSLMKTTITFLLVALAFALSPASAPAQNLYVSAGESIYRY